METNIYTKLFEVKKAGIKLQRDTKAFNYQYATLSQIQEKLNVEFEKQGLLIIHSVVNNSVRTEIIDTETSEIKLNDNMVMNNSVSSEILMAEWTKPQDKGSEITYYRRYNLLSLLDLEVEDDDGKKAQDSKPNYSEEKRGLMQVINDMKSATTVEDRVKFKEEWKTFAKSDKQVKWLTDEWNKLWSWPKNNEKEDLASYWADNM